MACSVLAAIRLFKMPLVMVAASLAASASGDGQQTCDFRSPAGVPEAAKKEIREYEQGLQQGPFYRELARRFGKPLSCSIEFDGRQANFSYVFAGGRLTARINPAIEFSEQRLDCPPMETKDALRLLKAAEKDAFTPDGCGIRWNRPKTGSSGEIAGAREMVYRGDTCNCKAQLFYQRNLVVAMILKSAC